MKADVYSIVSERIVKALEQGTVPWRKPWSGFGIGPSNLVSRKEYRGVNHFLLGCLGYTSPYWVTYKQAKALGGNVKSGEKAAPVVFWTFLEREKAGRKERFPMLRYYSVFNAVSQCEGLKVPMPETLPERDPIEACEYIVANMPNAPTIEEALGDRACYRPSTDVVSMPERRQFLTSEGFYATLFHELAHSTGHESRLKRDLGNRFGSGAYGREELVAEMTAAFLAEKAGISSVTEEATTSYLASWVKTIREDVKAVVVAAGAAQKASDYILGVKSAHESDDTQVA